MCVGDGETFQQLWEGRIERHPLRETSFPRKRETKGLAVGRRKIWKREEREREERREKGSKKSVKIEDRREGDRGRSRGAGRV